MPPKGPKPKFREGERIPCADGALMFEAKVLEVHPKVAHIWYAVRFPGWGKRWDSWVTEDQLLTWNADNLKKQREFQQSHGAHREKVEPTKRENNSGRDSQSSCPPQKKLKLGVEGAVP